MLAACGGDQGTEPQSTAPPPVDLQGTEPAAAIDQVLQTCHGPLRGTLDRCLLHIQGPLATEGAVLSLWLPQTLRIDRKGGTILLRDGVAWECPSGAEPRQFTDAERQPWQQLRDLIGAATLQPLAGARAVERLEPDRYRIATADGTLWVLTLIAGTAVPEQIAGPPGEVRFLDYLHTSATWIPKRVQLGDLGDHDLSFQQSDVRWDELFFADPKSRARDTLPRGKPEPHRIVYGQEHRPRAPEVLHDRARFWLVLDDPGDWASRTRRFADHYGVLVEQEQKLAGFAAFCKENGRARMMIPFRPRDGGRPFVRPESWEIRRMPAIRALVVFPADGSLEERIAAGSELLLQAAAKAGHQVTGAILAQPYFHLQEGVPGEEEFAELVVRMSVAIE